MISVTKTFKFETSHYLENPKYSVKENLDEFGACSGFRTVGQDKDCERKYHGHSYKMEVTVRGTVEPKTGFLINFVDLKKIVNGHVVDLFDHNCLNDVMPKEYWPCTVENMLTYITNETRLMGDMCEACGTRGNISSIKIWETEDSFAEWDSHDF